MWSYGLENILPLCKELEDKLIKHIWRTRTVARKPTPSLASSFSPTSPGSSSNPSVENSRADLTEKVEKESAEQDKEKESLRPTAAKRHWWSWKLQPRNTTATPSDPEKGGKKKERKLVLLGPLYAGLGAALALCMSIPDVIETLVAYLPQQTSLELVCQFYFQNFCSTDRPLVLDCSQQCLSFFVFQS